VSGDASIIIEEILPDPEMHDKFAERLKLVASKIKEVIALSGFRVAQ